MSVLIDEVTIQQCDVGLELLIREVEEATRRRRQRRLLRVAALVGLSALVAGLVLIAAGVGGAVDGSRGRGSAARYPLAIASKAASDACTSPSNGYWQDVQTRSGALAGAYTATAGDLGPWVGSMTAPPPTNWFAADPPSQTIFICYFSGSFPNIFAAKTGPQAFQSMIVAIPQGDPPQLLMYGPATGSLSFGPPPSNTGNG